MLHSGTSNGSSSGIESSILTFLENRYSSCTIHKIDKGSYGSVFKITNNNNENDENDGTKQPMIKALKVMRNVFEFNINQALKESTKMLKYANMNCNIARVYDVFILDPTLLNEDDDEKPFKEKYLCIEMEYYEMGSLLSLFGEHERPTIVIIEQILKQIVNAFKQMQKYDNLIHNDIKPNNILVQSYDKVLDKIEVVLSDFGQALTTREAINITPYASSTRPYYPNSELPSYSADIYALSMTIYEITTKKLSSHHLKNSLGKFDEEQIRNDYYEAGILDDQLINLLISMMSSERPSCDDILKVLINNNNYNRLIVQDKPSENINNNTCEHVNNQNVVGLKERMKLDFKRFSNLIGAQVDILSEALYFLSQEKEKSSEQLGIDFDNHWDLLCNVKQPEQLLKTSIFHSAKIHMTIQKAAEKSAKELDDTTTMIRSFEKFIVTNESKLSELLNYSTWKHYATCLRKYYEQFKEKVSKVSSTDEYVDLSMETFRVCGDFFERPFVKIQSSQKELIACGLEDLNKTNSTSNHKVTFLPTSKAGKAEYYFKSNGSPKLNPSIEFALHSFYQVFEINTIETGLIIVDEGKNTCVPIQISTAITCCKEEAQLHQENFEKQVLGVLLTCPSDGKPNNYVLAQLENSLHEYISIDNDEVFKHPLEKGYNNLKSFLLTLPNMTTRITKKTIEFFKNTPPFLLMLEWINKLSEKEEQYESMMKFSRFNSMMSNENSCIDFFSDLKPINIRTILNIYNSIVTCFKDNKNSTLNDVFKKCYPINFDYYKNKDYETIHNDLTKLNIKNEEIIQEISTTITTMDEQNHIVINPFNDEHIKQQKQTINQLKETLIEMIMNDDQYFIESTIKYLINKVELCTDRTSIDNVMQKMQVIIKEHDLIKHQHMNIDSICELFAKGLVLAKKYNIAKEWTSLFNIFRQYNSDLNWKLLIEEHFARGWTNNKTQQANKFNEIKGAISFERTISKQVSDIIFDTKNQFKEDENLSGRLKTTRWPSKNPIFYFKKYPEFPGLEFASTHFMRELGMKRVPHSELFMFYDQVLNEHYPVLIIEAIEGDIIAKKWNDDSIFNNIDYYETSLLILSSLLLNPEDQKEDNLILSHDGKYLIPIDNDRNFLPGIIYNISQTWWTATVNTSLQCKSFVFCLNEMHKSFHSNIIEFIKSFNIEIFIENWLKEISKINELYQQLFTNTNEMWDKHSVKLRIEIRKEYINNLYQKLYMLRSLILNDSKMTPFQFMKLSDPLLAKEYSLDSNLNRLTKKELFLKITSKYYKTTDRISRTTINSSKILMKMQTVSNMNELEGPQSLLNYFKKLCNTNNLEIEIISKYLKQDHSEKQNEKEMIELLFNTTNNVSIVSIYNSTLLTNTLFNNTYFIGKSNYIKILDLRNCKNLKEETLKILQENCNSLAYLNISGWNITKFGYYKIIQRGVFTDSIELDNTMICFPKLYRLVANDCSKLEQVYLIQNGLVCVELNNCSNLKSINFTSEHISIFNLKESENVTNLSVKYTYKAFSYLNPSCKTWRTIMKYLQVEPFLQREFILEAVKQNGNALEYADESFKKDREIVLKAVKQNGYALLYADKSLKKDREIVLKAVKQYGRALLYADESFKKDREIVLKAVKRFGYALSYVDESLRKDRDFILKAVKQYGYALLYADESFKKDREIVLEAVKQKGYALQYADESLRKDREIVLKAVKQDGYALEYADESLRKDREIVLEAVKQNGYALEYVDESFKKERDFILEAVKRFGYALRYVDESLKKDRDFILEAVKQQGYALEYADESLRKDREIILEAVKQKGYALLYADESFKKDREIVLKAVKQQGYALKYVDESLRKDREIVLEAVKQQGYALKYADESFKKDREIVLKAVKQNGYALLYADKSFKKDREIVLEAVKQDGRALEYADESFKKDREIVLEAVKQNGSALLYVDESLKIDREFDLI